MIRTRGLILAVVTASTVGSGPAFAVLEPHRAAYRLSLAERQTTTPLIEVRGGLVIEWERVCDGWLSRQRLGFVATIESGGRFSHDVRFSAWEALDGSRLRYTVRSFEGDEVDEEYRGEAWVKGEAGGVATFTAPEAREVDLPPGTVFPTDHLRRILAGAKADRRVITHEVFDGWGYDALTQITTVIGRPSEVEARADEDGDKTERAWPISMAYYNIERHQEVPEFEATFLLTEQGVLRDLALDYGDFRLDARLDQFELLARPDC